MVTLNWERIESITDPVLGFNDPCCWMRASVPGGWLVRCRNDVYSMLRNTLGHEASTGHEHRTSLVFIPDPQHYWGRDQNYITSSLC